MTCSISSAPDVGHHLPVVSVRPQAIGRKAHEIAAARQKRYAFRLRVCRQWRTRHAVASLPPFLPVYFAHPLIFTIEHQLAKHAIQRTRLNRRPVARKKLDGYRTIVHTRPNLDDLAFEFFREFSRCEYCLKVVGLREPNRGDPTADWGAFASEVRVLLETPNSRDLKEAVQYYLEHPPKKQIERADGFLDWKDVPPNQ